MTNLIVGCGYLGLRVGSRLIARGERAIGTVRSGEKAAGLAALGIEPLILDVLDPASLDRLPDAERILFCVGFDRSAGPTMRQVYVEGLQNVLDRLGGRLGRFVYASSTGVYGQDDGGWVDETSPAEPSQESGRVVLEAEGRVRAWDRTGKAVIIRYAGLYGPGRVVRRASLEKDEPIPGDPDRWLNMIHIDDAAAVAEAALTLPSSGLESLYLAADDRPNPRGDYYRLAASLLGTHPPQFVPAHAGVRREDSHKRIANRLMKRDLVPHLAYPDIKAGLESVLAGERKP